MGVYFVFVASMVHSSLSASSSVQVLSLHVAARFQSNLRLCFMRGKAVLCSHDFYDNIAHPVASSGVLRLINELERKLSWDDMKYGGF